MTQTTKRFAILYSDGGFNVLNQGHDLISAQKEGMWSHSDEDTKLVEVDIKVTKIFHEKNPRFQVATEHSANCPCCGTEVFIEVPNVV
jgi:hypothetical protein